MKEFENPPIEEKFFTSTFIAECMKLSFVKQEYICNRKMSIWLEAVLNDVYYPNNFLLVSRIIIHSPCMSSPHLPKTVSITPQSPKPSFFPTAQRAMQIIWPFFE